jgi:hypothetical protein
MNKKHKLEDYQNLSYDDKVDFIKSMNDLSLEEVTKVKEILDESTNPEEIRKSQNLKRRFDWLIKNEYFQYFFYASIFVWIMFLLNLFKGFNLQTALKVWLGL